MDHRPYSMRFLYQIKYWGMAKLLRLFEQSELQRQYAIVCIKLKIGVWPSGKAADSDSAILSSNLSTPAKIAAFKKVAIFNKFL